MAGGGVGRRARASAPDRAHTRSSGAIVSSSSCQSLWNRAVDERRAAPGHGVRAHPGSARRASAARSSSFVDGERGADRGRTLPAVRGTSRLPGIRILGQERERDPRVRPVHRRPAEAPARGGRATTRRRGRGHDPLPGPDPRSRRRGRAPRKPGCCFSPRGAWSSASGSHSRRSSSSRTSTGRSRASSGCSSTSPSMSRTPRR